jgi:hypothetical protein
MSSQLNQAAEDAGIPGTVHLILPLTTVVYSALKAAAGFLLRCG